MTTILDVARDLGVRPNLARRRAKRLGVVVQDRRGYVALDEASVRVLSASLSTAGHHDACLLPDYPGLPLAWFFHR